MMDDSSHDPIGFHPAKLLDEHLLRNFGNRSLQIREAEHVAVEEMNRISSFQRPSRILKAPSTPSAAVVGVHGLTLLLGKYLTFLCVLAIFGV